MSLRLPLWMSPCGQNSSFSTAPKLLHSCKGHVAACCFAVSCCSCLFLTKMVTLDAASFSLPCNGQVVANKSGLTRTP